MRKNTIVTKRKKINIADLGEKNPEDIEINIDKNFLTIRLPVKVAHCINLTKKSKLSMNLLNGVIHLAPNENLLGIPMMVLDESEFVTHS